MKQKRQAIAVLVLTAFAVSLVGCGSGRSATSPHSAQVERKIGRADVGGYKLAYECAGRGSPTVILEAGYTASGLATFGQTILPQLAHETHVCTYDRAGDGTSDPRPARMKPLTGATQARELHRLLAALDVEGPYIMVGHSYGGMVSREFSALYPSEVVGMVLIDASSEPEIPVYDRLHAGPWLDGTVLPAPNRRIDIHATVRQLEHASPLDSLPLIVVTAGVLEDQWLRTVPMLEAHAQTRLANLSTNAIHVVDPGVGHFIPERDPAIVLAAVGATLQAAQSHTELQACRDAFQTVESALCLARHATYHQNT